MKSSLSNFLIGGFIGIVVVVFADYLFYGEFSIRGFIVPLFTVLIIYLILLIFQNKKKKNRG